jgi:hypothetical protein
MVARVQAAMARRPQLQLDAFSLACRPWFANVHEHACALTGASETSTDTAAATRVVRQLDACLTEARARRLVGWMDYVSRHRSTCVLGTDLETALMRDNGLDTALAAAVAPMLAPTRPLAALDGRVDAASLGVAMDRVPEDAVRGLLDGALRGAESQLEALGEERAVAAGIAAVAQCVRCQVPQKALLVLAAAGASGPQAMQALCGLLTSPAMFQAAVGTLALVPLPAVAFAAPHLAALLAASAAAQPEHAARMPQRPAMPAPVC